MTWLDKPFFDLLSQINGMYPYFMRLAWEIGGVILLINIGTFWFRWALSGAIQEGKEQLIRTTTAILLFVVIMNSYPVIIKGLNSLIYKIALNATYTKYVKQMIDKTRGNSSFWDAKGDKSDAAYSDIIIKIKEKNAAGQISHKYVLDLYLDGTGYFSPNAVMRILMLTAENIFHRINKLPKVLNTPFPKDIGTAFLMFIAGLCVIFCGIFASLQYFIAALEFSLISCVGVITLPGMLWNPTKFMTEKLFGAIFGFFLKMLFVSIGLMLTVVGFLALMQRNFEGAFDQMISVIFCSIFYMMICQSGPKLAVSMLTGTPQMSLMEAAASAGTLAAGGMMAARGSSQVALGGSGIIAQGVGAAKSGAQMGQQAGGVGGAIAGGLGGFVAGVGKGVVDTARSGAHSMARSLMGGSGAGAGLNPLSRFMGGRGGGETSGKNRWSQREKYNTTNPDGTSKTVREFLKERFNDGQAMFKPGVNKQNISPSFSMTNKPAMRPAVPRLPDNNGSTKALPSSSTPSRLALPPPKNMGK